jgi:PAS domain S-box-containing protein
MVTPSSKSVFADAFAALPAPVQVLTCDGSLIFENDAYISEFGASAPGEARDPLERPTAGQSSAIRAACSGNARAVPLGELGGRSLVAQYFPLRAGGKDVTHVGVLYREETAEERAGGRADAAGPPPLSSVENATPIEQQLRFVIDMVPHLIWSTAPDGYHDFYNRRWYEYIGASPEETRGAGWNDAVHPDDQQRAWERWQHSLRTGEDYEVEYRFRRHDGVYRWFLGRALPMRDADGRIVRWFGTCTDIDDQKRLEAEQLEVLAQAEANSRMKDEFLATVSHELRTPLTAILGWARLQVTRPEMASKATTIIERNASAQVQLIEEILETSRIISGKVRLSPEPVDLGALVRGAVDTVRPSAEAKHIALEVHVDPALGLLVGDPDRLQQIAWNLLTNAVKFTPSHGRVSVSVQREGSHAVLRVEDTGRGIRESFLPHVFERFRQAEGGTTRVYGGLGLGLAIVRHLVELHGGTASATSPGEGQGATFEVRLPVRAVFAALEPPAPAYATTELLTAPVERLSLEGLRLLVVDDEPDARDLIATVLREAGAQIREAASVEQAQAEIAADVPDLLVSDIGMPARDGYSLIRALRGSSSPHQTIPAIALTAYARGEDRQRALDSGFQLHLSKPIDPGQLVAAVHFLARSAL